ncbi:MAG: hypothetical protein IJ620_06845 [Bacteroidales bacterium]|nr:hypothetical protein [Bacteroidales bacterium]
MTVIVNPISGVGRQKRIEKLLQTNLNLDLFDYDVVYTEHIHHGTDLARTAAEKGRDVIVAVGGDGSVNDVIAGMKGSPSRLGIIPCGSGNGLARCMNLPLTPAFAIRVLNQYNEDCIDTIVLNDKYIIASIAGVGFDAHIARLMRSVKTRGFPAYMSLMLREYNSYVCRDYKFYLDNKETPIQRDAWFISVANSNQFGYAATIAPKAKLDDGFIDISVVDKVPLEHLPVSVPLLYANHIELSQHVELFKARDIVITGNIDKWVNIDGEGENVGKELHFENHHKSLNILSRDKSIPLIIREDKLPEWARKKKK